MPQSLPVPLALCILLCLLVAGPAWWRGRRTLALRLTGGALAVAAAGTLLALAVNAAHGQSNNLGAPGLAVLAAVIALAALCQYATRRPRLQATVFGLAVLINLGALAGLLYLLFAFTIF